jgi:hypothetical protein
LYNSVEIKNLFEENNNKAIQFKIAKLKNTVMFASSYFTGVGNLTEEEISLLDNLSDASLFQARSILDQNYNTLKTIFAELPTFELLQDPVRKRREKLSEKRIEEFSKSPKEADTETENETDSETGNEMNEDKDSNSENETTSKDKSSELSSDESSKTENGIVAEKKL